MKFKPVILIKFICLNLLINTYAYADYECFIEPSKSTEVGTPTEGILETVYVDKGDVVKRGQVIAELKSDVEQATVSLAKSRSEMRAAKKSSEIRIYFAKKNYERLKDLHEKKFVSHIELDEVETEKKLAELNKKEIEENIKIAKLELNRAKEILNMKKIRSPLAGIVVERFSNAGEYVREKPILELAQINPLYVEVILPTSMLGQIKKDTTATVFPEYPKNKSFEATVKLVDSIIDAASGTFGVRLVLENPNNNINAGLKCNVKFN
ncbi:MAG: efflux RND transporter periplasmic adaptor subunit [Methyloprofundus sp.]|nr:efflux RND transporter periplasmic adaptor subunit [Methyloprofundus sp.]